MEYQVFFKGIITVYLVFKVTAVMIAKSGSGGKVCVGGGLSITHGLAVQALPSILA